jgi:hypothetical protein
VEQHTWIQVAGSRAHHEPTDRGEAHGGVDANAASHSRHARPVSEVRDDDAPVGRCPVRGTQLLHNVLAGEAVEAVPDDTCLRDPARQGVDPGDAGHPTVEGCIKACYLRDRRIGLGDRFDGRQRLGHVIGISRDQRPQVIENLSGNSLGFAVAVPAVDDPVPYRHQVPIPTLYPQSVEQGTQSGAVIRQSIPILLEGITSKVLEAQPATRRPDPLCLRGQQARLPRTHPVECGLEAGRARVDGQQMLINHNHAPFEAAALPAGDCFPETTRTGARSQRYGERGRS